jgi:hydroxymethylbilane synthase
MRRRGSLRVATRGSDLAVRQAAGVADALEDRRFEVELVEVETRGDRVRDELIARLGRTGAFVRALDERVLAGDVDAAVHSMKDVPTEMPDGLEVAGVPERAPAGDVLVTPDGTTLADLPEGAVVGTSSLRRRAQLLAERPDLDVRPLRGNVDTRVEKLLAPHHQATHERLLEAEADGEDSDEDGDGDLPDQSAEEWFASLPAVGQRALERRVETAFDAIVLAEAGLRRTGLDHDVDFERLPRRSFVPAAGQGALAVTARPGEAADAIRSVLDHPVARVATTVERTVLGELGGGCVAPIGISAVVQGEYVNTRVRVLSRDGTEEVAATRDLAVSDHAVAAVEFAADLRERGAADIIERARREFETESAEETVAADAAETGAASEAGEEETDE